MPCTSWNEHGISPSSSCLHIHPLLTVAHHNHSHSLLNPYYLISVRMNLCTYIRAHRNTHKCHLGIAPRPERMSEMYIIHSHASYISHIWSRTIIYSGFT